MCSLERVGEEPFGGFTSDKANAKLGMRGHLIWQSICLSIESVMILLFARTTNLGLSISIITKSSDSFKVTGVGSDCVSSKSDSTYDLLLSAIQATSEANKQGEKILNQIKKENVLQLSCEERDHNLGSNGSCPKVNVSSDDLYKPLSENRRKSPIDSAVIKVPFKYHS